MRCLASLPRVAVALALAAGLVALPGAATAESPAAERSRWVPYQQPDLTYEAGDVCAFAVFGKVVRDREFYRNVSFWEDGTARTQLWRGPLVMRWENMDTGKSVVRDQSGHAIVDYYPNADVRALTVQTGHFGAGLPAGSAPRKGLFYIGGRWSALDVSPDGTHRLVMGPGGTAENLCRTLAG